MTSTYLPGYLPDAGKGSAVCSCSALWDPLPCSSPSTPDCLGAPFGRGTFPGGQVRFLGDFGVLVYPPSGVARQSHCTPALLSILMSLGHCTDHCSTRSKSRAPEKKKKNNTWPVSSVILLNWSRSLVFISSEIKRSYFLSQNDRHA